MGAGTGIRIIQCPDKGNIPCKFKDFGIVDVVNHSPAPVNQCAHKPAKFKYDMQTSPFCWQLSLLYPILLSGNTIASGHLPQ